MKQLFNIIGILFIVNLLVASCDKIEEPYANPIGGGGEDTNNTEVPKRVILLEDYTGHTCVNCPWAAETAHGLKQVYGEQLVVMAVHAGFFAMPLGEFTMDFRTEEGTALDQYFGISAVGNPNGMVNRIEIAGSRILGPDSWGSQVASLVEVPPVAFINLDVEYDDGNTAMDATVTTTFLSEFDTALKLCVYITEDSIQAPQKNNNEEIGPTPVIEDYYHNHVLRGSINGTWGELLNTSGTVQVDDEFVNTYSSYTLDPEWNPDQCSIIAFVYNDETKEILQAAEQKVVE